MHFIYINQIYKNTNLNCVSINFNVNTIKVEELCWTLLSLEFAPVGNQLRVDADTSQAFLCDVNVKVPFLSCSVSRVRYFMFLSLPYIEIIIIIIIIIIINCYNLESNFILSIFIAFNVRKNIQLKSTGDLVRACVLFLEFGDIIGQRKNTQMTE